MILYIARVIFFFLVMVITVPYFSENFLTFLNDNASEGGRITSLSYVGEALVYTPAILIGLVVDLLINKLGKQ